MLKMAQSKHFGAARKGYQYLEKDIEYMHGKHHFFLLHCIYLLVLLQWG